MISLEEIETRLGSVPPLERRGRVIRVEQGRIEATGPLCTVGDLCIIDSAGSQTSKNAGALAEVISVQEDRIVLSALNPTAPVLQGAKVTTKPEHALAPVGDAFVGRVVDAFGEAMDGRLSPLPEARVRLEGNVMSPLDRAEPDSILQTGIKAIDGLTPIGEGQRIGIFAASGVGKTTLICQLAGQVKSDHCILCLVGERGREVEHVWRSVSQNPGRFTCIAATSDQSAAMRARAVSQALCLAEYWRAKQRRVLLVIDSITRLAMALRELGLAAGAPPTLRAYTPNVFSILPRIVERCGARKSGGSITAVITVLSETDDVDDPISETMRSLLDGHIVLSRKLAEKGHFPAIDILRSVSRQSERLMSQRHAEAAQTATTLLSRYDESRLMIETGLYKTGSNTRVDEAVRGRERLLGFLRQRPDESVTLSDMLDKLRTAAGGGGTHG